MLQGRLPFDRDIATCFKEINWKTWNAKHRNKYGKTVAEILDSLKEKDIHTDPVIAEINLVYESPGKLDIEIKRSLVKQTNLID